MSTASYDPILPDSLLAAVGRVATASARLEDALRRTVGELTGDHDAGWIILEGQSTDWLILNGNAVLSQYVEDAEGNNRLLGPLGKHLRTLFKDADKLNKERNIIIHGDWSTECHFPEICESRSPASAESSELFHVLRSRYRKGYGEEAWSLSDIKDLASELDITTLDLYDAISSLRNRYQRLLEK